MNWRGRPLTNHVVVVKLISSTTTSKGLQVYAELDKSKYPTKIEMNDDKIPKTTVCRHGFHGDWNYTIRPHG